MEIRYRIHNQDGDLQEEGTLVGNWREDGRIEFNRPIELHQNQKIIICSAWRREIISIYSKRANNY